MADYLRSCARCRAHILVSHGGGEYAYCPRCLAKLPSRDDWEAELVAGARVYVHSYVADPPWNRSEWVVLSRDGDELTLQVLGMPERRISTSIAHVGDHRILRRISP